MGAVITEELIKREEAVRRYIEEYAALFELDANLVRALLTQESRIQARATSPTGAYGFGQFTNIGAKQVQLVSKMTSKASDLANFSKKEAEDPDRGIKAVCAFLWWLFYVKYKNISDKKVQLEACLTFYNSGGRPAALVIKHGGHDKALPEIKALPARYRSQADRYAPEVSLWYVAWHDYFKKQVPETLETTEAVNKNPFDSFADRDLTLNAKYKALVEALQSLAEDNPNVDVMVDSHSGWTEVTVVLPGEY